MKGIELNFAVSFLAFFKLSLIIVKLKVQLCKFKFVFVTIPIFFYFEMCDKIFVTMLSLLQYELRS